MKKFEDWLLSEEKDIFGFEKPVAIQHDPSNDVPVNTFDIEYMTTVLKNSMVGNKKAHRLSVGEVLWGESETGALKITIHPDLHVLIEKLSPNLLGKPTWITKKLFQINRNGYGGHEELVAKELLEELDIINDMPIDSINENYQPKDLRNLVIRMAFTLRSVARDIFVYEGVREVNDSEYIIRFSVRGHGVESPDHGKVEENQTLISYNDEEGLIRILNYNIESQNGKSREWAIKPSDTDLLFLPSQSVDEIVETMATTMRWY